MVYVGALSAVSQVIIFFRRPAATSLRKAATQLCLARMDVTNHPVITTDFTQGFMFEFYKGHLPKRSAFFKLIGFRLHRVVEVAPTGVSQ